MDDIVKYEAESTRPSNVEGGTQLHANLRARKRLRRDEHLYDSNSNQLNK